MSLYGNTDKAQNSAIANAKAVAAAEESITLKTDGSGAALPTSDPAVAGALWANVGVVTVSAG